MELIITKTAAKNLRKLPKSDSLAIITKLEAFAKTGEGDVKKLVGEENTYRLRHGNWRAIFEIVDGVVVLRVAHRSDVYG